MRPAALALALLAILALGAIFRSRPTPPAPLDAPAVSFSARRAEGILRKIVDDGAPHPVGSPAHDRVREQLVLELATLGLAVQRHTRFVCGPRSCATVSDLLARIPGRVGANAVVLTAHYDSVAAGPGASDDGMGVVTVLEAARAILAAPRLRRPVWLVFTDGEELGLFGAKAIVADPALAGEIGVVVNVEARGTSGPSLMFETSARNAGLVRAFAQATDHPVASSLLPTLYSILPNDTDLSVYKGAGLAGLNYALIGGAGRYHTPRDDLAHADLGSLQHHGDDALAVVRALADGASGTAADDDLVFFDVLGAFVIRWPARATLPGALVLLALLVATAAGAVRSGLLRVEPLALGAASLAAPLLAGAAGLALSVASRWAGATPAPWIAHPTPVVAASAAIGALAATGLVSWLGRRTDVLALWWGAAASMAVLGTMLAIRVPGVAFLFLVPAGVGGIAIAAWVFGRRATTGRREALAAAMPAAAVIVWAPILGLVYDGLGTAFLPALAVGTGVVVWSASPLVLGLAPAWTRSLLRALAGLTVASAAASLLVAPFDADVPAHASIRAFVLDGKTRAILFAPDSPPASLRGAFSRNEPAWPWSREVAIGSVEIEPSSAEAPPSLEVLSTADTAGRRRVTLRLKSSRGASAVGLALRPSVQVRAVRMAGKPLSPPDPAAHSSTPWPSYECLTTPPEGIDLELDVAAGQTVDGFVYDRSPGLPEGEARRLADARGPAAVAYGMGDYTVVARPLSL